MAETHQVEIVIHVDEPLGHEQQQELIRSLKRHEGIVDARFTPKREHLLVVDYDRDMLKSQDILGFVKKEHVGAELVGPM
jgi:hypothetical protein